MNLGNLMKRIAAAFLTKNTAVPVEIELLEPPVTLALDLEDRVTVTPRIVGDSLEYGVIVSIDDAQEFVQVLMDDDTVKWIDASLVAKLA